MNTATAQELRDLQGKSSGTARPIRWGELADVIELFTPAIEASIAQVGDLFGWLVENGFVTPGQAVRIDSATGLRLLARALPLVGRVPELLRAVQRFTAIVTDQRVEQIEQLGVDEGLQLALAAYAVNQDFFLQRLLPLLRDAWVRTSTKSMHRTAAGESTGTSSSSA